MGVTSYSLHDLWLIDLRFAPPVLSWVDEYPLLRECESEEVTSLMIFTDLN